MKACMAFHNGAMTAKAFWAWLATHGLWAAPLYDHAWTQAVLLCGGA